MTQDDIIQAARELIGTPFVHQGRIPGRALDCAGLVVAVAQAVGVEYIDQTGYSRSPSGGLLEAALDEQPGITRIAPAERAPSDVLLMRFAGDPQHLALLAGSTIIHAYEAPGLVCEHDLTDLWARRIVRVYRFKGLASPRRISSPIPAEGVRA